MLFAGKMPSPTATKVHHVSSRCSHARPTLQPRSGVQTFYLSGIFQAQIRLTLRPRLLPHVSGAGVTEEGVGGPRLCSPRPQSARTTRSPAQGRPPSTGLSWGSTVGKLSKRQRRRGQVLGKPGSPFHPEGPFLEEPHRHT